MNPTIISSLITGGLAFLGVVITNWSSNQKMQSNMDKNQAVMKIKLEDLTEEVRKHNNFAQRVPVLEEKVSNLTARIDKIEKE